VSEDLSDPTLAAKAMTPCPAEMGHPHFGLPASYFCLAVNHSPSRVKLSEAELMQ
jgi:hypothetical protein